MLVYLELGGDGDEIDAIEKVEAEFGIAFDADDWERFVTVGDVWAAVLKELRLSEEEAAPLWLRFAEAIAWETGVDPRQVGPETVLIGGPSIGEYLRDAFRRLMRR